MSVTARLPHGQTRVVLPGVTIKAEDIETDAVETLKIKNANVTGPKLATGSVSTPKIVDANVTALKLADTVMKLSAFTGKNGAGACTLTGAKVGDIVIGVVCITDGDDQAANFETTITVADQIQQSSASNLSTKKYAVLLIKKGT